MIADVDGVIDSHSDARLKRDWEPFSSKILLFCFREHLFERKFEDWKKLQLCPLESSV